MEISREVFEQQRHPRFGNANPERMQLAFWEWMVRQTLGPYEVRGRFDAMPDRVEGPVWTFDRMGATRTALPEGREVCVGGEVRGLALAGLLLPGSQGWRRGGAARGRAAGAVGATVTEAHGLSAVGRTLALLGPVLHREPGAF
jgi:hypothetical protein